MGNHPRCYPRTDGVGFAPAPAMPALASPWARFDLALVFKMGKSRTLGRRGSTVAPAAPAPATRGYSLGPALQAEGAPNVQVGGRKKPKNSDLVKLVSRTKAAFGDLVWGL